MKKALIAILVALIVGVVAVITCPDKQTHKDAIMDVVNEMVNKELQLDDPGDQEIAVLLESLGTGLVGRILDNRLVVKNHFLWSTGELRKLDGDYKRVSVGVFGHIFTFNKDDLDKEFNNAR